MLVATTVAARSAGQPSEDARDDQSDGTDGTPISVGGGRYRRVMAEPAARTPPPTAPPAEPAAIRACLHPDTAAVFDQEWEFVLEEAKHSHDLTGVHELLHKWRFFAVEELTQPGWYGALMTKAERTLRTGVNPGAVPWQDLHEVLARRRSE